MLEPPMLINQFNYINYEKLILWVNDASKQIGTKLRISIDILIGKWIFWIHSASYIGFRRLI